MCGLAPAADTVSIVSVGYAGFETNAVFVERLRAAGVERLVDVRAIAGSRRRGFSKTALAAAATAAGIEYVHVPELGNPKEGRELYRAGRVAQGRARYARRLRGPAQATLAQLAASVLERRCALMCVERDPAQCHRAVIVAALRAQLGSRLCVVELAA